MPLVTDREKGAHLLRRFGLGASEAELDFYLKFGLEGAIDRLLNYEEIAEPYDYDLLDMMALNDRNVNPNIATGWWILKLITTRRPLQEKMTVFWHDHFATSAEKVTLGSTMHNQIELLRKRSTSDFHTILTDVSKDPAMLFWLDNQFNTKGKPNENFAREIMELFTLGEGQGYTEEDIKEAARAFTGWTVGRSASVGGLPSRGGAFQFRALQHDTGAKHILGKTGMLNGDDVIDILCEMPRTAEYLVTKIWEWFVYPKPEQALVKRFASTFRQSNLSIKSLLRAIMRSDEFYSPRAERAVYKNPVDFVIPTLRQLGVGPILAGRVKATADFRPRQMGPVVAAAGAMKQMGMQLLYPPDVNGWPNGSWWVSSATMVARIGWADRLFGTATGAGLNEFTAYGLFNEDATSQEIASTLASIFDAPIPKVKMAGLAEAAKAATGGRFSEANANKAANAVTRLLFATPEFQFC